jgi:D-beta-D-heptose 7-phosphate kinase/D-beta-D-heptose 1-phosphate adenosyltransferase
MTVPQKLYNVLLIGDTCWDVYNYCSNTRLNPESSAPLVQVENVSEGAGMSANVRSCLKNLGLRVKHITSPEPQWSIKLRYIDTKTHQQLLRVDTEQKPDPAELENSFAPHLYDAVVISDYNKGFVTHETIDYVCKYFDGPIFLDTKKKKLAEYSRCFIKINEAEANAAESVPVNTIVTLGAQGVRWYNEHWPAFRTQLVDVCGAGDAFLAGMVYGYLTAQSEMIEHGIVNAGISVSHLGTYAPNLKELKQGLNDYYQQCRDY